MGGGEPTPEELEEYTAYFNSLQAPLGLTPEKMSDPKFAAEARTGVLNMFRERQNVIDQKT